VCSELSAFKLESIAPLFQNLNAEGQRAPSHAEKIFRILFI
jgi:hypothetical protein